MERLRKALLPAALLMAAYWIMFGGEYSLLEVRRTRAARAEEAAEVERLRLALDSLKFWGDSLEVDSATLERLARERFGLIRDGEILYRFAPSNGDAIVDSTAR